MNSNDKFVSVEWFDQGIQYRLESYENMLIGQMKLQSFKRGMFRHDDSILDLHLGYMHALTELGCITPKEMTDRLNSFRSRVAEELNHIEALKKQLEQDDEDYPFGDNPFEDDL